LSAVRCELTATEWQVERQRQAAQHEKNLEVNRLAHAREAHRQQISEETTAKKEILGEMRRVRDQVHGKLAASKARTVLSKGVAGRALAQAGQRALTAREASEAWQDRAAQVESRARGVMSRGEEGLATARKAATERVAEAQAQGAARIEYGQRLLEEATQNHEQLSICHAEHCAAQERHHEQVFILRCQGAERARHDANAQVSLAVEQARREQERSVKEIQAAREAAQAKVAEAQLALTRQRRECEATIEREKICAAQGRRIGHSMREQQDADAEMELRRLEANMQRVATHLERKLADKEAEDSTIKARVEQWESNSARTLEAARTHAAHDEAMAEQCLNAAKVQLANLQAQGAAYIRELQEKWEQAKRADAAKVEAAQARTEKLMAYCEETMRNCERQCEEMLKKTERHAQSKQVQLEERVSTIDNLSKQRVAMMQRQSRERRQLAEQRLEELKRHLEDVKKRTQERVQIEAEAAEEKVNLARKRYSEQTERMERHAAEVTASRAKATEAYEVVMARCRGAAKEAQRRGLDHIVAILEMPEACVKQLMSTEKSSPSPLPVEDAGAVLEDVAEEDGDKEKPKESPDGYNTTGSTVSPGYFSPPLEGVGLESEPKADSGQVQPAVSAPEPPAVSEPEPPAVSEPELPAVSESEPPVAS